MIKTYQIPYTQIGDPIASQEVVYFPMVQTAIEHKGIRTSFLFPSLVDSGSRHSVFPSSFGEKIGVVVDGVPGIIRSGFGGSVKCYYRKINIIISINNEERVFPCEAAFTEKMNNHSIGVLGRDFFEQVEEISFHQKKFMFEIKVLTPSQ